MALRPNSRLPIELEEKIRDLTVNGGNPGQIKKKLGEEAPDLRTIRDAVEHYRAEDTSGDWTLADAGDDADAGRLVFETLDAINAASDEAADEDAGPRRPRRVTKAEAAWIVRVRRARPDKKGLSPYEAYQWAKRYLVETIRKRPTTGLDLQLARLRRRSMPDPASPGSEIYSAFREGVRDRELEQRFAVDNDEIPNRLDGPGSELPDYSKKLDDEEQEENDDGAKR